MIETRYPGVFLTELAANARPIEGVSTSTPPAVEYPGVYLTELPAGVHSIEGVATSTAGFGASTDAGPQHTPEWTNHNDGDPGVTLLQMFAFLTESMLYRTNLDPQRQAQQSGDLHASESDSSTARIHKP